MQGLADAGAAVLVLLPAILLLVWALRTARGP